MEAVVYPWEKEDAMWWVKVRQPVHEIKAPHGIRHDLTPRRPSCEMSPNLSKLDFGIVIMSHRGFSNGRLSVCLSSIPYNIPVTVCSDDIDSTDLEEDRKVCERHHATLHHCTPWGGRAKNAIECMKCTTWEWTIYLCDDVWLFPETPVDMLRWSYTFHQNGIPMAALCAPRFETYHEHREMGFDNWPECLEKPWKFECLAPPPKFQQGPSLYKNPFGACMMMYRPAYEDLGGFASEYWAHDDVYNHKVWFSRKWVNCCYPGRGFVHYGNQSGHHGETAEWIGAFKDATGWEPNDSGAKQYEYMAEAAEKYGEIFLKLGGQPQI